MTDRRGRPTRATSPVNIMLPMQLLAELRTQHPEMLKPLSTEFKYGALSKYIEGVLWKDLRGKPKYVQSQVVRPGVVGPGPGAELDPSRGFPGSGVHAIGAVPSWDEPSGRKLGGPEFSDEQTYTDQQQRLQEEEFYRDERE